MKRYSISLIVLIIWSYSAYAQCNTTVYSDTTIANATDTVFINTYYENIWVCEGMNVEVWSSVGNMWIEANCHVEIYVRASSAHIKSPGFLRFNGTQFYYEPGVTILDVNGIGRKCSSLTFDYSNVSANDCTIFSNVDEEKNSIGFKIFPNPNNGIFSISFSPSKKNILSIYNMMGELIHFENISDEGKAKINIQSFSKGIYLVELRSDTRIFREKILVQ